MDDDVKQQLLLGRERYAQHDYAQAEYLLRQVVSHADRYADVHHMLGVICHAKGDFTNAKKHFEKAVILNPQYTEAQLNLMVTYNELGQYDDAREIYSRIRARTGTVRADGFVKGKLANMHAEVSQAYLDAGMRVEAIRELEIGIVVVHLDREMSRIAAALEEARRKDPADLYAHRYFNTEKGILGTDLERIRAELRESFGPAVYQDRDTEMYLVP